MLPGTSVEENKPKHMKQCGTVARVVPVLYSYIYFSAQDDHTIYYLNDKFDVGIIFFISLKKN